MSTHPRTIARTILAVAALTIPSARAAAQTVNVDFDHEANFGRCTTYSWVTGQPARNPYADALIVAKIDEALAGKGWSKVETDATCLVMYQASLAEKKPAQVLGGTFGPSWGVSSTPADVRVDRVLEGMLVVDIGYANRQIIWRAVASDTIADSDARNEQMLTSIVTTMFKDFPPPSKIQ
jgi:Domain of unknown function (DUF4136)